MLEYDPTSSVKTGVIGLCLDPSNFFLNDLDDGVIISYQICRGHKANTMQERIRTQMTFCEWTRTNKMMFNGNKYIMHIGTQESKAQSTG